MKRRRLITPPNLPLLSFGGLIVDAAVVCIGTRMQASILATLHLKELGVKNILDKGSRDLIRQWLPGRGLEGYVAAARIGGTRPETERRTKTLQHCVPEVRSGCGGDGRGFHAALADRPPARRRDQPRRIHLNRAWREDQDRVFGGGVRATN
jgi:hypothetical protein